MSKVCWLFQRRETSISIAISWDYAYTLAQYMVLGQYDKIPFPDGFTDEHVYFRTDMGQSPDKWGGILRIAGNVFFYYVDD